MLLSVEYSPISISRLVYQKRFRKLSQKAGNFGVGGLKNLRAGRLGIQSFRHTVVSSQPFLCDELTGG